MVTGATDSGAWYAPLVGKPVYFEWMDSYGYWAREGGTYNPINYIPHEFVWLAGFVN